MTTNYNRLKNIFYGEEEKEKLPKLVYKALFELANINFDYYDLIKELINVSKKQDLLDLEDAYKFSPNKFFNTSLIDMF